MDLYGGNSGNLTVLRRALAAPALPDKPVTYEYAELRYSRLFVGGQMGAVARLGAGPPGGGGVVGCSRSRCWGRTGTGRATNDGQVDHRRGLEVAACECYQLVRDEYDRMMGKRVSGAPVES